MTAYPLTVPEMGEQKETETVLNSWLVAEGQFVSAGDEVAELVTDKAAFILPAPASGRVKRLLCAEGTTVKTGEVLVEIEEEASASGV